MRSGADANIKLRYAYLALFSALSLLVSCGWAQNVAAANTTVKSVVCNSTTGSSAQLSIISPANDSVVVDNTVTVSGTLKDVTQVDVEIDGAYNQTFAIPSGQTTFTTTAQVATGTHTIKLTGNDMCNITNPVSSVVVTYQPGTTPSTGSGTPTVTPAQSSASSGPRQSSAPTKPTTTPIENVEWVQNVPLLPEVIVGAKTVAEALDFDELSKDGVGKAVTRFSLFTLGLGLMFLGPRLLSALEARRRVGAAVAQYVGGLSTSRVVSHLHRNNWLVIGAGMACVLLTFVI